MLSSIIALRFYVYLLLYLLFVANQQLFTSFFNTQSGSVCTYLPYSVQYICLWKFFVAGFKSDASFRLTEKQRYKQANKQTNKQTDRHPSHAFLLDILSNSNEMTVFNLDLKVSFLGCGKTDLKGDTETAIF